MAGVLSRDKKSGRAAEKVAERTVAAGLPRHVFFVFNVRWRRKAAATPFFSSLLGTLSLRRYAVAMREYA